MSSQPLLQTAPGKLSTNPEPTSLNHIPQSTTTNNHRQANRPPHPRRAQSLLRQRAHLPLLAQFHRHPRWTSRWTPELRRPHRSHFRRPIHRHCHGRHDLCPRHIPLASTEHPAPRTERHRRPIRSHYSCHCASCGCCGELYSAHQGWADGLNSTFG
jgi:hypothetical protein